jgi:hypothetical protein
VPASARGWVRCSRLRRLATRAWRRIRARDPSIGHVLGPFGPRPVPLLMPARRVRQPTGGDAGELHRAGCIVDGVSDPFRRCGVRERPRRGGHPRRATAPASRRQRPHREEGDEDNQEEPRAMTVEVRAISLWGGSGRWVCGSMPWRRFRVHRRRPPSLTGASRCRDGRRARPGAGRAGHRTPGRRCGAGEAGRPGRRGRSGLGAAPGRGRPAGPPPRRRG